MSVTLCPVIYSIEAQKKIVSDFFDSPPGKPIPTGFDPPNDLCIQLFPIAGHATIFKNPAFAQEKEWRLVHTPMLMQREGGGHAIQIMGSDYALKQRVCNGEIRSYFELPLPDNFLKEIWLGPKCRVRDLDLTLLLSNTRHFETPVKRSTASYR